MIPFGPATRIFLAPGPTDMRRSFDGLSELVRHSMGADPLSGHLFIFTNRRRNRLKILVWDCSGLWVCAKRLEKGTFHWPTPEPGETKVRIGSEELALLLGGLDWPRTQRRRWWRRLPAEETLEVNKIDELVTP
jgi:transposase